MSEQHNSEPEAVNDVDATSAEANPDNAESLQLLLEDARAKADEHWNQLLRVQAEAENVRRRAERDVENAHRYGLEKFAAALLPVKDSLELGLNAVQENGDDMVAKLREGTELTLKMLSGVLEKFGIQEVDPMGQPFNPDLHQAMTMQPSAEYAPNTVVLVMQKGYTLNERQLRPAMVVVSKAP